MIYAPQKQNTSDQAKELSAIYESIGYLEEEAKKIGHDQLSVLLKNILNYANDDKLQSNMRVEDILTQHEFEDFYRLMCIIDRINVRQQGKMRQLLDVLTFYHSTKKA